MPTFSVGLRFFYWGKCEGRKYLDAFSEDDNLHIDGPKYPNIKEEFLNSGHCNLLMFNALIIKCDELMLCKKVKEMTATEHGTWANSGYGIKEKDPITKKHVQCVVAYCDFSEFCTAFSATFRSEFIGETVESIKKRNKSYFNISKGLREAVECFGNNGHMGLTRENGPFYCGMDCLLLLTQFGIRLNGPTSTSKSVAVAIRFAGRDGIVLKMNNDNIWLSFFDCVPFSRYPEEQERLFIGGRFPMMIKSVLITKTAQDFSSFFGVLSVFDFVVKGTYMEDVKLPPKKDHKKLQHLLGGCLGKLKNEKKTLPDFIYRTFDCFRENKTEICLDLYWLGHRADALKVFYEPILHSVSDRGWDDKDDNVNMLRWDNIFAIFPNTKVVTVDCGRDVYGFSLSVFVRKVCGSVFSKYLGLESVVVRGVDDKAMRAATEEMNGVASECNVQLLIQDKESTFILKRDDWNTLLEID